MGDVGSIYVYMAAYALSEEDQTDGDALHEEEADGIRFTFDEDTEFAAFEDEDILRMVEDGAEIFKEQLTEALLSMRDALIEGAELADVYELYLENEPDWEV